MQAKEIANIATPPLIPPPVTTPQAQIDPEASLPHLLRQLVDEQGSPLRITGSEQSVDMWKTLNAVSTLLPDMPETSVIEISCTPRDYSASAIARAVEDADANLLTLMSRPAPHDMLEVSLRIDHADPAAAVHSLERYGYSIRSAYGQRYSDLELSQERIAALQHFLNI